MKNSKTALTRFIAMVLCLLLALTAACTKAPDDDKETTVTGETTTDNEEDVLITAYEKKIIGSQRLDFPYRHYLSLENFDIMVNYTRWATEWNRYYIDCGEGFHEIGRVVKGRVEKVIEVIDIEPSPTDEYSEEEIVELPEYSDDEDHETDDLSTNHSYGKKGATVAYLNAEYEEDPGFEPEFEGDMRYYKPEHATVYNIIVEETFFGDETKTLKLYLYGTPDSPLGTTKPEIGDNLLLVLLEDAEGYCRPINFEMSMFRINDNGTVYSFHDDESVAWFDGKPFSVLEDKILEILGKKFTGSDDSMWTYWVPSTFEELVMEVKETGAMRFLIVTGKVKNIISSTAKTYYNFAVDKTLFGEEFSKLKLCLLGSPNSDISTTKPNVGDNLLLVLWSNDGENYSLTSYERSMFRINDDGTVYSFHNDEIVAQFDGKSVEFLESTILDILEG